MDVGVKGPPAPPSRKPAEYLTVEDRLEGAIVLGGAAGALGARLQAALQERVMPHPNDLARLRQLMNTAVAVQPHCQRYEADGCCRWLRTHGAAYDLLVPPVGAAAVCLFGPGRWQRCPGYRGRRA